LLSCGVLTALSCALACGTLACRRAPEPPAPAASPVGSVLPASPPTVPPTYWNRVATILESHCTSCHAAGGIGPMDLTSFETAKTYAGPIVHETSTRHMPPWLPETASCAELRHPRALPQRDVDELRRWAEAGAPEGSRADYRPPPPRSVAPSLARPPDRVATPAEPYLPKRSRADDYHCFVLDPGLERAERVVGLRIQPGLGAVVHHVLLFEVRASAVDTVRALDAKEPGPGYTCFGGIGVAPTLRPGNLAQGQLVDFDTQMIVGWAPGAGATEVAGAPTPLPAGTAVSLAPGSRLVMQVHYSLENQAQVLGRGDQTRVEMWLAKDEPLRQAIWIPLLERRFEVPPGAGPDDPRAVARAELPLPFSLEVRGVAAHMHLRGRSIRVESLVPGAPAAAVAPVAPASPPAPASCLLDIPRWDFRHQEGYWLDRTVRVDRASVTCRWDNRADNQPAVKGVRKPPRALRWGEGTDDEMCLAFLYATL